jgi:hypothetical protein
VAIDQAEMLEVLLASTALWQTLCGVATVPLARAFVHREEALETASYPRAIVVEGPSWLAATGTGQHAGGGQLWLTLGFSVDTTAHATRQARRAWVRDQVITLRQQMLALAQSRATPAGYSVSHLAVRRITLEIPPRELAISEQPVDVAGDLPQRVIWAAEMSVEY